MVPGMTERERLAADARRIEWLADATIGPARLSIESAPRGAHATVLPVLPIGLWRRGLASARVLGRRIHLVHPFQTTRKSKREIAVAP